MTVAVTDPSGDSPDAAGPPTTVLTPATTPTAIGTSVSSPSSQAAGALIARSGRGA